MFNILHAWLNIDLMAFSDCQNKWTTQCITRLLSCPQLQIYPQIILNQHRGTAGGPRGEEGWKCGVEGWVGIIFFDYLCYITTWPEDIFIKRFEIVEKCFVVPDKSAEGMAKLRNIFQKKSILTSCIPHHKHAKQYTCLTRRIQINIWAKMTISSLVGWKENTKYLIEVMKRSRSKWIACYISTMLSFKGNISGNI